MSGYRRLHQSIDSVNKADQFMVNYIYPDQPYLWLRVILFFLVSALPTALMTKNNNLVMLAVCMSIAYLFYKSFLQITLYAELLHLPSRTSAKSDECKSEKEALRSAFGKLQATNSFVAWRHKVSDSTRKEDTLSASTA